MITVAGGAENQLCRGASYTVTVEATQTDGDLLSATNSLNPFTVNVTPVPPTPAVNTDTADANTVAEGVGGRHHGGRHGPIDQPRRRARHL